MMTYWRFVSVTDSLQLEIKRIPFLEKHQHHTYQLHSVDEVMAQPVQVRYCCVLAPGCNGTR